MIAISELSKRFGKLDVLRSVNIDFEVGKAYALVGPNASGKTTLIKCILGMVVPDQGEIKVASRSIRGDWSYRRMIGYMPQIGRYPEQMKIAQVFDMIRDLRNDHGRLDEDLVREFKLDVLKDKRMHTLSGGTRQKVSASLAFLFDPAILILDEPTAGLDPVSVEIVKEKIVSESARGKTVLITSHILNDLDELCSQIAYLDNGQILFNNSIDALKDVTGETRLGKAVAEMMKSKIQSARVI
jgi:Cu-processing system ATP-binding protein